MTRSDEAQKWRCLRSLPGYRGDVLAVCRGTTPSVPSVFCRTAYKHHGGGKECWTMLLVAVIWCFEFALRGPGYTKDFSLIVSGFTYAPGGRGGRWVKRTAC